MLAGGDPDADAGWQSMMEQPIGAAIADAVANDVVRGVMATDALIGTFARTDDASLEQNVCFLYHLLGSGTGEWDVPIGGMGAVSGALAAAARAHGAEIITGGRRLRDRSRRRPCTTASDGAERVAHGRFVLSGVTPTVLAGLLGEPAPPSAPGAQVKVNLMLSRLPRLRDDAVTAEQAFGGTFHVNESLAQLDSAYDTALAGAIPTPLPCEIYCHSLSDPDHPVRRVAPRRGHRLSRCSGCTPRTRSSPPTRSPAAPRSPTRSSRR